MSAEELRRHMAAVPFRPFTLNVADGRRIPVLATDFMLISPSGRITDVFQPDDSHDLLDTLMITGISFDAASAVPPSSKPPAQ
jgi:hypothetical protein